MALERLISLAITWNEYEFATNFDINILIQTLAIENHKKLSSLQILNCNKYLTLKVLLRMSMKHW